MDCDNYLELLSLRLDGALTEEEERELEAHMAVCPDCRAAGAQLAALRSAFDEWEDVSAPEGFAQGVMDRIRAEESRPKVIPLFKRPQFRALAGLAACLVLVVGLYSVYSAAQPRTLERTVRITVQEAQSEGLDVPEITAYSDPGAPVEDGTDGMLYGTQKCAPDEAAAYDGAVRQAAPRVNPAVLVLDRMPEGGWELIPPETPVSPEGIFVTRELFEEIERMGQEQNITAERNSGVEEAEEFVIVILEEMK